MAGFKVLAIAAWLLLAVSGSSFAANRMADTKSGVNSQSRTGESGDSASSRSATRSYTQDPYLNRRDDPYAPGVNWPGRW